MPRIVTDSCNSSLRSFEANLSGLRPGQPVEKELATASRGFIVTRNKPPGPSLSFALIFSDKMERVSKSSLLEFLSRRPFSVVHVDADWDGYRKTVADRIRSIQPQFEQSVSFGYLDCDAEQEYAREIGILNVPSVAYYNGTTLIGVVIGVQQDMVGNIERLRRGESLDQTNVLSRG